MTEINGTVVCFDGVCPMCLNIVSLMRPIWEPRGVGFVPLQAEWVRRRLNLPEAELLGVLEEQKDLRAQKLEELPLVLSGEMSPN